MRISNAESSTAKEEPSCIEDRDPQILLEPKEQICFGPIFVQKQLMDKEKLEQLGRDQARVSANSTEGDTGCDSDERRDVPSVNQLVYDSIYPYSLRGQESSSDIQQHLRHPGHQQSTQRTALLNYENSPPLPPVWETHKLSRDEDDNLGPKSPSLIGHHNNLDAVHNYVNTENVTVPASAHRIEYSRHWDCTLTVFNFDIDAQLENTGGSITYRLTWKAHRPVCSDRNRESCYSVRFAESTMGDSWLI